MTQTIPSYLYKQYSDDDDLQAFVSSYNTLAQSYLDWFNDTPLGVYTSNNISGPLLDWIGQGIYGIKRPALSTFTSGIQAGYSAVPFDIIAYNELIYHSSGSSELASDDVYKRTLTWDLYKGDGDVFCLQWLKNRVARFINGPGGTDCNVLDLQPSISVSGSVFTITAPSSYPYTALQLVYANNELSFPFQYSLAFVTG